jgi:hypothetical protein
MEVGTTPFAPVEREARVNVSKHNKKVCLDGDEGLFHRKFVNFSPACKP